MKGRRTHIGSRIVVTVMAAVALAVLVGPVSAAKKPGAGNPNTLDVQLKEFPGPLEVTYGENVSSTMTVSNPGGNPWHNVIVTASAPETQVPGANPGDDPVTLKSTLDYVNFFPACPSDPTPGELGESDPVVCDLGRIEPNNTQKYTIILVWKVPSDGSSVGCGACLLNKVAVTGKEGTNAPDAPPSSHEDTFTRSVETALLDSPDTDKTRAGTYATDVCDETGETSLETNQSVGTGNQLSTSFCAPDLQFAPSDPGLVVTILERGNSASEKALGIRTQVVEICAPDLQSTVNPDPNVPCEAGYDSFDFASPNFATSTFVIDEKSVKGGPITRVFYDADEGGPLPFVELGFAVSTTSAYIQSITPASGQKVIVVVRSPGNGWNGFG